MLSVKRGNTGVVKPGLLQYACTFAISAWHFLLTRQDPLSQTRKQLHAPLYHERESESSAMED